MMNQEQFNAIKERVAKATQGPWEVAYDTDDREHVVDIWFDGEDNGHAKIHDNSFGNAPDNAKFISHAREDVPALVSEVERLQKLLDIEERNSSDHLKASTGLFKKVEILNSENSKFRKALEEIMEDQAPIMEGTEGWETRSYEIARKALGGEAHE
ncbi:hypothetical protein [Lysinibacillus fusiformis]|uniref:Ead/Ea22-like family protein n=1 Tax=Lysinibacillus fusiformis TaxID=28031 RepID=A0A1E4R4N6_9BACI|nr:hypothetical protein [Lysinibacillus fusiformis]ODV55442.1 hypothetical protein BG258_05760 [Lysinibacillus fusiformis]